MELSLSGALDIWRQCLVTQPVYGAVYHTPVTFQGI